MEGDSLKSYCVAILVPKHDELLKIAQELQISGEQDVVSLCKNPAIVEFYNKSIHE